MMVHPKDGTHAAHGYQGESRRLPTEILKRTAMRLNQVHAATKIEDLHLPPSNHLEKLKGDRNEKWSIRINGQWRVCFRFVGGHAFDVEIVDYHSGGLIMTYNGLPPIHPGEYLTEILKELRVSQAEFARAIGVSPMRISHITKGARPVTAELALLFGRAFDQSPQYWMNLQTDFDLKIAESCIGLRLVDVHTFVQ